MVTNWRAAITYLGGSEEKERELIQKLAREVHTQVQEIAAHEHAAARRPQHAKTLAGVTNALFRIADDLAPDLQVGFLKPGNQYPAIVRFSNAGAEIAAADGSDLRGAAIQITPDEGGIQDFLMTNAEKHHAKNALEAMATSLAFYKQGLLNKIAGVTELAVHVGPVDAARIISTLNEETRIPVESAATETFWSRAPLRIGEVALKYRIFPVLEKTIPEHTNPDLRGEFKARLQTNEIRFLFQAQRYINEELTPLEDARYAWQSPFESIAELILPQQELAEEEELFKTLHFNPWRVNVPDIEPIGNMNRARKMVYPSSVNAQHAT